jgi:hypothetical protein
MQDGLAAVVAFEFALEGVRFLGRRPKAFRALYRRG